MKISKRAVFPILFLFIFSLALPAFSEEPKEETWSKAGEEISEAVGAIGDATKKTFKETKEGAGEAWQKTKESSSNIWKKTKETSENAAEATKQESSSLWQKTKIKSKEIYNSIKSKFQSLTSGEEEQPEKTSI